MRGPRLREKRAFPEGYRGIKGVSLNALQASTFGLCIAIHQLPSFLRISLASFSYE